MKRKPSDRRPTSAPSGTSPANNFAKRFGNIALEQFGYMAKCVLNSWGVHNTGDFGNIVFNLIEIKQMKKTRHDRREDFDNVFDFDEGLLQGFKITVPQKGNA